MTCDLEIIRSRLSEKERLAFEKIPAVFLASLNEGDQILESNLALQNAIMQKLSQAIEKYPMRLENTALRIFEYLNTAKAKGAAYTSSTKITEDFNVEFRLDCQKSKQTSASTEKSKTNEMEITMKSESKREQNIGRILSQLLFRSFFFMLTPHRRKRLIDLMVSQSLCDPPLVEELNERINEEVLQDEEAIEAVLVQIEKGGLASFRWLHDMLFDYFNKIMEYEDREAERKQHLEEQTKKQEKPAAVEAAKNPTQNGIAKNLEAVLACAQNELVSKRDELNAKNTVLQAELKAKEELFTLRLEKEKMARAFEKEIEALKSDRRTFETEHNRLIQHYTQRLKLAAHTFESFLDTLPRKYSSPGYTMLRSIINEAEDKLESIQAKEQKYAPISELSHTGKSTSNRHRSSFWFILGLLVLALAGYGAYRFYPNQAKEAASRQPPDSVLKRFEGMNLNTQDDIDKATTALAPLSIEERSYLVSKSLEIQTKKIYEVKSNEQGN